MKPAFCITVQYKSVIITDFKVKEGAENMLIPSTVGSSILTKKPDSKESDFPMENTIQDQIIETTKHAVNLFPLFTSLCDISEVFTRWLTTSGGGCKKGRAAQQIVTRCLKFLRFCCEDEEELTIDIVSHLLVRQRL